MARCQHPHHQHPEHQRSQTIPDAAQSVAEAIAQLRALGLRRTRLLEDVLGDLARRDGPVTIGQLNEALGSVCDPATLYRMVERLVDAGILRKIGLHERALFYEMIIPGRHRDYLICSACGAIGDIHAACPLDALESELAQRTHYTNLHHELVFYGICPECQAT